jgi:hypothetical protein
MPARAMAEQPDDPRQALSLTRERVRNSRKAFGEDPAIAPLVPAAPATHSHPVKALRPSRSSAVVVAS